MTAASRHPSTLDRSRYEVEVDDRFDGDRLDERLWLPCYLPHWSSRERSAARYDVGGGSLRLRIDADQQPWSPEYDGHLRVSSLQTGEFAGPVGSSIGQLRFRDNLVVREAQPNVALYTPRYGLFELRCRAIADATNMVALWMIGYEDAPERSGEICICEIFGRDVGASSARVGMGIHPWGDPNLTDAFATETVGIDATESHIYSAEWTPDDVAFYVDDALVKVVGQSPAYPMQFMLNIYEFADGPEPPSPPDSYPKTFVVERFTGWRPVRGPGARPPAYMPRS
jgi:glycosyl hydrolase family 16